MQEKNNMDISAITHADGELLDAQLEKIFASSEFKSARKMREFLSFLVHKVLVGEEQSLKQYTIAVEAMELPDDFDSDINPAVRIMGGRVRDRLEKYYQGEGENDAIFIGIPKGAYIPLIQKRAITRSAENLSSNFSKDSQGPKLGLFCFEDSKLSPKSNHLLVQISSTLTKELSNYIFLKLYVQIPFLSKEREEFIGNKAKENYGVDFSLLLYIHELPKNKYELVYRLWDNKEEEVLSSEIFTVYPNQPIAEQNEILNKISAVVADFHQGTLHNVWGRSLLRDKSRIPIENETLVYHRHYADNFSRDAFKLAVTYCSKALQRSSTDIVANVVFADYCRRDYVYDFQVIDNALEKGRESADLAIRLKPDSHEAHFVLAQILFCTEHWQESINEFNLARDISKNQAIIEYGTGFHFCLMGEWKEGLRLVEKAMSLSDSYPTWYHLTTFLDYYRRKKYKEALVEALKIKVPNLLYAPIVRCVAYVQLGEKQNAKIELQNLLTIRPNFLKIGLGILTRFLGDKKLAQLIWDGIKKASV